ncbi:hypothetical protein EVAR_46761_1 [Eumeta japonica]|uniref:Uncharacterized protein n=1 Tax=Eumeta variegata TaxID=151549 RepID=A0A4C2AB53_EUMVA|nr:hypothetical protein EVAR_46761_1 [Eumeta japonica]
MGRGRRYIPYRTHESPADVVATPVLRFNLVNFQFYKSFGAIVTLSIDGHDNVPSSTARVARLTRTDCGGPRSHITALCAERGRLPARVSYRAANESPTPRTPRL